MSDLIERTLPSGAILKFNISDFKTCLALKEAVMVELKNVEIRGQAELADLMKN